MENVSRARGYIVILVLCIIHVLVPIERGFPAIRIGGYPITVPMLVSIIVFTFLFVKSGGHIVWALPKMYVPYQIIVVCVLLISALISNDVEAGLFNVLLYSTIFIVDFLILYHLFNMGFREQFSVILCIVASIAALIGIVEGTFHYYLPFYKQIFLSYDYERISYTMIRSDFRALLGTLGNPLVYSVAMVLVIPFAMEIRNSFKKFFVVTLLILASFLAASTTSLIMGAFLLTGYYLLSRRKTRLVLLGVGVVVFIMLFVLHPFLERSSGNVISAWTAEFDFRNFENPQAMNIQIRRDLFIWALEQFWSDRSFASVLFGHGLKSSITTVSALRLGNLQTFDNTYINLLFESGIMGLAAFLLMGLNMVVGFRKRAWDNLHWYSVLSLLVAGMAFTTIYYGTFNFIWVASVAALSSDTRLRRMQTMVS